MTDIVIEKVLRPERVLAGSWLEVIASNLDYHRATFLWKCEGLSDGQLRQRSVPSSDLTLLALMRHLQGVERYWLQHRLADASPQYHPYKMYAAADGSDWFDESDPTPAKEVYADYLAACADSRSLFPPSNVTRIVANPEFGSTDLRFILTHVIEEYARHTGHADLLRQSLDGATGE
ncbi:DinB family protein [Kribbella sp. NPDC051586]|uniref:DinB family protein n=1 Tax=Kribbella sp. NPDC051586 TaxID=3364118 RepID=UPI00378A970E